MKHGKGVWRKNKNDVTSNKSVGQYQNDKKHGYGEFFWTSGNNYKGNYSGDERDGFGEMHFTDGTTYIGNWCRGLQTGKASMILPDGSTKEGFFSNNIFYGDNSPSDEERSSNRKSTCDTN